MSENADDTTSNQLTLFAGDSPARTSAMQGNERASKKALGPGYGMSSPVSFARLDPSGSWLKTYQGYYQLTLVGEWEPYSETWPRAGTMLNGIAYRQQSSVLRTSVIGSSSWPTPTAGDGLRGQNVYDGRRGQTLVGAVRGQMWPTPRANDAEKRGNIANDPRSGLPAAVRYWPTPRANERGQQNSQDQGMALSRAVKMWPTPCRSDALGGPAYSKPPGRQGAPLLKEVMRGDRINPTWEELLMGFPHDWTAVSE